MASVKATALPCGMAEGMVSSMGSMRGLVAVKSTGMVSVGRLSRSCALRCSSRSTTPRSSSPCTAFTIAPGVPLTRSSIVPTAMVSGTDN